MTTDRKDEPVKTYRMRLGARRTITLPTELCDELGVSSGDALEIRVEQNTATISPVLPPARGILRGYFASWEDVNRFVEEERRGWEEREVALNEFLDRY